MTRSHLLGAASAAALACISTGAFAQAPTTVTGGGSTLALFDYNSEFTTYNNGSPVALFNNVDPRGGTILYWGSGSGTGQTAFLNNDNTCNSSRVITGTTTCANVPGGANAVAYGASDATLSSTQISSWETIPYGRVVSGALTQVPSMGIGISIPVVNTKLVKNGGAVFKDNDLCQIFTGGFTDWNQTSAKAKLTAGTINVVFRGDGSGTSFIFLNHLVKVCTGASAPPAGVTLSATSNFATIFPKTSGGIFTKPFVVSGVTYYTPTNFIPQTGSGGVANYLSSLDSAGAPLSPPTTSSIAYLSPDYTTIDPASDAKLSNGQNSQLLVASVFNPNVGTAGKAFTPTTKNITTGLNNAKDGTFLTPPAGAALTDPNAYVPLIQTTNNGYSLVGYTTFDFAQCYKVANVGQSVKNFLSAHYGQTAYKSIQSNNGFVNLNSTKIAGTVTAVKDNILSNKNGLNIDIQNATACKNIGR